MPTKSAAGLRYSAHLLSSVQVRDIVYVTAAGPPSRLYGLKTKSGARQWEFKCPVASAVLADLTGPCIDNDNKAKTVFLAYNNPSSNSSWLQALDIIKGDSIWRSAYVNNTQISRVEMLDSSRLLATSAAGDAIMQFNSSTGALVWQKQVRYCSTPSPIAELHSGKLLLPGSCNSLQDLALMDAYSGDLLWDSWEVPEYAEPAGNCTWVSVKDGSLMFGCSCSITGKGKHSGQQEQPAQRHGRHHHSHHQQSFHLQLSSSSTSSSSSSNSRRRRLAAGVTQKHEAGICMYSVSTRSGKLQWVQAVAGNASFPPAAQTWGVAPLIHQGLAIFAASDQLLAVDSHSGKLVWTYKLEAGETLPAWQLPVLDPESNVMVLTAQRPNKTAVTAVGALDGKLLWRKPMNGTAQLPRGVVAGAEQLCLSGGRVYVEACRGQTCCLRALNVTSGKQRWGMCLQAERGEDATHPHAQFAIWIITVVTIGSIALLILGACLLYVHRWMEERRILDGANGDSSPRRTYRPLPDRTDGSDSDKEDNVHVYQGLPVTARLPVAPLAQSSMFQRPVVGMASNVTTDALPEVTAAEAGNGVGVLPEGQQQRFVGPRRVGGPRNG